MIKRILWTVAVIAVAGCTADYYKRSADLQVDKLLQDRETKTLDYVPQVEATTTADPKPTRKAYDKLPTTVIPPTGQPPIVASSFQLSYSRLGPQQLFPTGTIAPKHVPLSVEGARQPAIERLRLGPLPVYSNKLVFDLFQSIQYAIQHSRDYQSRMEDLYLAALDVTLQRHLFEPRPFAKTGVEYAGSQADVGMRSALNITNSAGIRQQLPYGGEIVAQGLYNFVNALNDNTIDGESAQAALTGSIPLLRGAGMVNLEPLISSERSLVYAVRDFEVFRRQFVVSIASQFINLITSQQNIANARFNYILSYQNREQSLALYSAGRATSFQSVQRTETSLYSAENTVIQREDSYQSSLDNFKILIGMPVDQPLDVIGVELEPVRPDLDSDMVATALKYRLELQTASDRMEDAQRSVDVAKNGLLPDLDFSANSSIANRDNTSGHMLDSRTMQYSAAVDLDLPIDRVAERNAYRRSLILMERSLRSWQQQKDVITSQVRSAVRSIRNAEASLEISRTRVEVARQWADYSNQLLILGRSTSSQDSVDAQNQLLSAQDAYEQARANYQIQILSLLRDTGLLRLNPDGRSLGYLMDRSVQPKGGWLQTPETK